MSANETYTRKFVRELRALKVVFRSNWLLGIAIAASVAIYILAQSGIGKAKESPPDQKLATALLAELSEYRSTAAERDRLKDEVVKLQGSIKAQQAQALDAQLSAREAELRAWAERYFVVDPTKYNGGRLPSKAAVDAWLGCVRNAKDVEITNCNPILNLDLTKSR